MGTRARSLLIGTIAAVGALAAAVAAGAVTDVAGGGADRPVPEVELRFGPEDEGVGLESADLTGDPVPEASFVTLDGRTASFADYRGAPLVVNFLASWCVPCQDELPDFQRVHDEVGTRVTFLGLNPNDRVDDATAFVQRLGVTFDVGRDPNGELFEAFGVAGMPSTFFVSAEGEILGSAVGKLSDDALRSRLDELFPT